MPHDPKLSRLDQDDAQSWLDIVADMQQTLEEVEAESISLHMAINRKDAPVELRQLMMVAQSVLTDGRKVASASRATGMTVDYMLNRLLPILNAVLKD